MQSELFGELSPTMNPARNYDRLELPTGKIVQVPRSTWADGRTIYDLRSCGGGKPKSRDATKAKQLAIEELVRLQTQVGITAEALRKVDAATSTKPRLRNKRANNPLPAKLTEPSDSDCYYPCDYKGLFSNCPAEVDAMIGPTHLEKRLFSYAFAQAKIYRVKRIKLNWVRTAAALAASPRGVSGAAVQLRDQWNLFWFKSTQGSQLGATIRFIKHPAIALASSEHSSEEKSKASGASSEEITQPERNTVQRSSEVCSRPINKEKISQEEKTLTDRKWLETVVQPKFPKWSIEDLREQWRAHHKRGKEKGTWVPSDRQHFLKAWMPNAGDPPPAKKNPTPGYWTDFISERYPNAVIRDFATLKRDYPSLVDEGARWAEANGRQDKKAS